MSNATAAATEAAPAPPAPIPGEGDERSASSSAPAVRHRSRSCTRQAAEKVPTSLMLVIREWVGVLFKRAGRDCPDDGDDDDDARATRVVFGDARCRRRGSSNLAGHRAGCADVVDSIPRCARRPTCRAPLSDDDSVV